MKLISNRKQTRYSCGYNNSTSKDIREGNSAREGKTWSFFGNLFKAQRQ